MLGIDISTFILVVALAVDFTIRVVAVIVVPRNRRPTSGMAWLLAIFFIPGSSATSALRPVLSSATAALSRATSAPCSS